MIEKPYNHTIFILYSDSDLTEELKGHEVCDALGSHIRTEILLELVKSHPERLSISEIKRRLGLKLADMTIHFHLQKLKKAGLVELDGSGRGFRALSYAFKIEFDHDGLRVKH
jgi:predicted transcriptional regulator